MLEERILFADQTALVLDKPAGLAVTRPKKGGDCLEDQLGSLRLGFSNPPLIVHRLDRDTSGCLLLARNPKALKKLNKAFSDGLVGKTYWAIVDGELATSQGCIDMPLVKLSTRERGWWMEPDPAGKAARTHWRTLGCRDGQTMVEFRPETGRTHQLRVHASKGLGAAIVGDPVYGTAGPMMLLHARTLSVHREGKQTIEATADLPDHFGDWRNIVAD
jgi:tRNA pseudouridine32 synthase/23S rRNA pseudouridine746 synthase